MSQWPDWLIFCFCVVSNTLPDGRLVVLHCFFQVALVAQQIGVVVMCLGVGRDVEDARAE